MFAQISAFEAAPVHCFDNPSEHGPEPFGDAFEFHVKWILEYVVIDVAHQMHETLLLLALERIIRSVKIGDQNTRELAEHLLEKSRFPRWLVEVVDLIHGGQNPNIAFLLSQSYRSFINVDDRTFQNALEDLGAKALVESHDIAL